MTRIFLLLLCVLLMTGCGGADTSDISQTLPASQAEQTEYISYVPSQYFRKSGNGGQVIVEHYGSRDYTSGEAITKTAYVYLPNGYDGTKRCVTYST